MIYRLLVRSRYLLLQDMDPFKQYTRLKLSILRVSKLISQEAMAMLYSDSVFRFVINVNYSEDERVERSSRLKRVAPMMRNVDIDINGFSLSTAMWIQTHSPLTQDCNTELENAENLKRSLDANIDPFGGVNIKRRNLHIRFLDCCPNLLGSTPFSTICQRLKALVGFRIITVETLPLPYMYHAFHNYALDDAEETRRTRDLGRQVTHAVAAELQPTFGPAISVFKFDADSPCTPKGSFFDVGDKNIGGFLEFHPGKQSVKQPGVGEEKSQSGLQSAPMGSPGS